MSVDQNSLPYSASFSDALKLTFDRAESLATKSGEGIVSEAHLLAALCDDPDALTVLLSNKIDIGKLKSTISEVGSGQGGNHVTSQVKYSADVKRLLVLAIKTSMEIKLPKVDGAVFIVVMIGDQNNYSAKLLNRQGLTFEAVVKNLRTRLSNLPNHKSADRPSLNQSSTQTPSPLDGIKKNGVGTRAASRRSETNRNSTVVNQTAPNSSSDTQLSESKSGSSSTQNNSDFNVSNQPNPEPEAPGQADASFEDVVMSQEEFAGAKGEENQLHRKTRQNDPDLYQTDIKSDLDNMENYTPEKSEASKQRYNSPKAGRLFENIPRSMKLMIPRQVEVRMSEQDSQNIHNNFPGKIAQHDILVTEAMSVQLKAPDGGFAIESQTPETQWIDTQFGLPNSTAFGSWRWLVTPTIRGRRRLQLVVSSRTVNETGLAAEKLLPEQIIDVRVKINYLRKLKKLSAWTIAAISGGLLGKYGETAIQWLISQT